MNKKILAVVGVFIVSSIAILFYFKPQIFKYTNDSMLPNFKAGQIVEIHSDYQELNIGDVIIYETHFKGSNKDSSRTSDIHRIIALAGDTINYDSTKLGLFNIKGVTLSAQNIGDYSDKKGGNYSVIKITNQNHISYTVMQNHTNKHYLYVWAKTYKTEFPHTNGDICNFTSASFSCVVPKGYVFVAGDNLDNSLFGLVAVNNVLGKATPY